MQAGLWDALLADVNIFLSLGILAGTAIGAGSRYASMAAFGGFLVFTKVGSESDLFIWKGALYLTIGVMLVVMALRLWGFASGGELE